MGNCRICGEQAGWFKDIHDSCIAGVNAGVTDIKSAMTSAVEQIAQGGTPTIQPSIEQVIADKRIPSRLRKNGCYRWSKDTRGHGVSS